MAGSEALARREHGDESQEDSCEWRSDRDDDDKRREGQGVHADHGSSAVHQMRDRVIECAGTRLARHAVGVGAHVSLTRERREEQVAAHLSASAQRDERPHRRTKFNGRSEDQGRGTHEDSCTHDGESATTR